jgi:hypothetical protein
MLLKIFFPFLCFVSFISCNTASKKDKGNQSAQDAVQKKETAITMPEIEASNKSVKADVAKSAYTKVTKKAVIKILSIDKVNDTASRFWKSYAERCYNWNLEDKDILDIVLSSKEIDGHEFHHFYDVLPCHYSGTLDINGKSVLYEVNAGAFTTLHYRDTSIYLGYKNPEYKKYFIIGPGIE